jgi:putative toxin-antitoxin system antitoxin component (TIGR02293 family)
MSHNEKLGMVFDNTLLIKTLPNGRMPTELLLGDNTGELSQIMIYKLIIQGFNLKNVQEMLAISDLYSKEKVVRRILGKSLRMLQRLSKNNQPVLLNSQQSAVAFQYAKILELAIEIFGNQALAEEWLGRPCKFLADEVPLDVIDNAIGFQAVEDYLHRIDHGIYQ